MRVGAHLLREFRRRVHGRVDLSSQRGLGRSEDVDHLTEADVSDDHHVDIAPLAQLVSGRGTVDERGGDSAAERPQGVTNHRGDPAGLRHQRRELRIDGRGSIRLKEDLVAAPLPGEDTGGRQGGQLALRGPFGRAGPPKELPKIEGLVRMCEQPSQQLPTGRAEEHQPGVQASIGNHIDYDCNLYGHNRNHSGYDRPLTTRSSLPRSSMTLTATWR